MNTGRLLVRNQIFRNALRRKYHADSSFKAVSMNDMPVPNGSWKANYDAKQTKYNMHLLIGIAFTAVTLITARASGLVYLNYSPPAHPADE